MMAAGGTFATQLRDADPWRFPPVLFLDARYREDAACLYCFAAELARIPRIVSEPGLGEIRLQWWREIIGGDRAGEAAANPLSAVLLDVIARHRLNRETLARIAEARAFDLYHDPMGDTHALEGWLGETQSVLFHEAAVICGAERGELLADAAGHAGVAYGSALLLRELAGTRAAGRIYPPSDMLAAAGLTAEEFVNESGPEHSRLVDDLCAFAEGHRAKAAAAIKRLPKPVRMSFLPLTVVGPVVRKARKLGREALLRPVEPAPVALQLACWKSALAGL